MRKNYRLTFYIVTFLFWGALYSHVSILSGYAEKLKASAQMIGIITGSYGFMQFLLRLPLGILSDRLQKRKIFITAALVTSCLAGIVMFLTPSPTGLLIGRILCGISACFYVQITVLFSSYFEPNEVSKAMGIMVALMNLSQMIAMLIGGVFTDKFGVSSAFLLTSSYAFIGIIVSFFIYEKPFDRAPLKMKELKSVMSNRCLLTTAVLAIICQALAFGKSYSFVPLAAYRAGATGLVQSLVTTLFTFSSMVAALSSGKLTRVISEKKLVAAGFLFHAVGSFIIPIMNNIPGLLISQMFSGIGNGLVFSLLMGISLKTTPQHKRGSAMGLYQAVYAIGMFTGPVIFGSFADVYPLNYGFTATGILAVVGYIMVFVTLKNTDEMSCLAD